MLTSSLNKPSPGSLFSSRFSSGGTNVANSGFCTSNPISIRMVVRFSCGTGRETPLSAAFGINRSSWLSSSMPNLLPNS
ncbi:Uncharacterised protein [Shigella sonnei]|nr:Uncharacterised protein [Shigella sonnei]